MSSELEWRLPIFLGVFGLMAFAEYVLPRRTQSAGRQVRWPGNIGIQLLNSALLRLVFPGAAVGLAVVFEQAQWGVFHRYGMPVWIEFVLSMLILDLAIYLQHVASHRFSILWRLHRMHHADTFIDVTTGGRFHPLEILLSMLWKALVLMILGAPVLAVLVFEVVLNATALFNHANLRIPIALDRALRCFVVTPDMHRVHHSVYPRETNSNYGFNLPWWDRLFGTYIDQPRDGHDAMRIGLTQFREAGASRLDRLLLQPFRSVH